MILREYAIYFISRKGWRFVVDFNVAAPFAGATDLPPSAVYGGKAVEDFSLHTNNSLAQWIGSSSETNQSGRIMNHLFKCMARLVDQNDFARPIRAVSAALSLLLPAKFTHKLA